MSIPGRPRTLTFYKSRGSLFETGVNFNKPHLSDPISNGKKVLDWLEGKGGRLVGEPVQQGLLEGQVGRVQRLEDVRLKTVAGETFYHWTLSYGYNIVERLSE